MTGEHCALPKREIGLAAHLAFRRGESSGSIDLTQGRAADLPGPSVVTPADVVRVMMQFNRACWSVLLRIYGFGKTA